MATAAAPAAVAAFPADLASGKGHRDENFPVASWLLAKRHRAPVMAFYRFARAADDIADHPTAAPTDKLARLAAMRRGLDGVPGGAAEASALRIVLDAHGLTDRHARDLLLAFEQDVTVHRYADWAALIDYCRVSAMPVGRFVLDVHGEDRDRTWPASDALCAALQILNHLQDCGKDYRTIDRVYIPADLLGTVPIEELGAATASPALLAVIREGARRTQALLIESAPFAARIRNRRLAAEVAVIQRLAEDLTERLLHRDPLSEQVHHRPAEALALAAGPALRQLLRRRA